MRLKAALDTVALGTVKAKIGYVYDLGASWEHEIVLEKVLPVEPGRAYPVCTAFAGDYPVEYPWADYGDGPVDPEPERFDLAGANRALTSLYVEEPE